MPPVTEYAPAKIGEYLSDISGATKNIWRITNTVASSLCKKICSDIILSLEMISSSKFTVFPELLSWKTIHFSKQIIPADNYASIFPCQMGTIVYKLKHKPNTKTMLYAWNKWSAKMAAREPFDMQYWIYHVTGLKKTPRVVYEDPVTIEVFLHL